MVPPHIGYGSEADSMGSVTQLMPKPPRRNLARLMKYNAEALRYPAKLVVSLGC